MEGEIDLALVNSNHDYCHPINGAVTSDFKYSIDLRLKTGDPIFSTFEGVIRISQCSTSYENIMIVRHDNGLERLCVPFLEGIK